MKKIGIKRIVQPFLVSTLLLVTLSCRGPDHDTNNPLLGQGTLIDYGSIPVPVEGYFDFALNEFQPATYSSNFMFVATSDGLWKNNLLTNVSGHRPIRSRHETDQTFPV